MIRLETFFGGEIIMLSGDDLKCEFCEKTLSEAGGSMHVTFGHVFCNRQCEWLWRIKDDVKPGDKVRLKEEIRNSDRVWVGRYRDDFMVTMVTPDGRYVCHNTYPVEIIPIDHVEIVEACSEEASKSIIMNIAENSDDLGIDIRVEWARRWAAAKYGVGWIMPVSLPKGIDLR